MPDPTPPSMPLRSQLVNEPDMKGLVEIFVEELPARIESLRSAWSSRAFADVQRIAHQLRGASAGYGFPTIGQAAARLEDAVRQAGADLGAGAESLQHQVNELAQLCSRAVAR